MAHTAARNAKMIATKYDENDLVSVHLPVRRVRHPCPRTLHRAVGERRRRFGHSSIDRFGLHAPGLGVSQEGAVVELKLEE